MTEIIILIVYPFLSKIDDKFPIIALMLLIAIAPALWVGLSRKFFLTVISIGMLAFAFNVVAKYRSENLADKGFLILLFLYALFFFMAIAIIITKISSSKVVTADTIKGGISVYFLLGLFWAILYRIVLTFDPDALSNIHDLGFDVYYYSFITLTTLGYGDIAPVADYAKILAILEAVTGPVYLAIFVAQLIGLSIAQKMKD
ncbi:MAG: two pore domain potassium channel family protein [Planctomycetes bacterium]|nr:two pore domain potassium channel family protein [Planctomycetota bacterium]